MVDTQGLGPCGRKAMGVQVPSSALTIMKDTKSKLTREENGNITLQVEIPVETIQKAQEGVIDQLVEQTHLQGFRKGKAPKKVVLEHSDPEKIREETLRKLLPNAYMEAIQEHNLRPMMNPKIHVEKVEEGKPWVFTATTCEVPEIKLRNYRTKVQALTSKSKIAIPGKEQKEPNFDEIMEIVTNEAQIKIPQLLVEQEVDRFLAQTLDEIKRLGLTLEQYLSSTGKSPDQLRTEYEEKAKKDIKVELVLQKIAEEEKIEVDEKEIEEAVQKAKDPQEKSYLEQNKYLLASILRQQKTLDFLKNL